MPGTGRLDLLGAAAWAAKAQQQLAATGQRPGDRAPEGRRECRRPGARSLTSPPRSFNREIADLLYLPRSGHAPVLDLPKLGIRSRAELTGGRRQG
jgi:hypothetical protein